MSTQPETPLERVKTGTAVVCADADSLRAALLDAFADAGPLDRAVAAIHADHEEAGAGLLEALDTLNSRLQAARDPRGLYGAMRALDPGSAPAGVASAAPGTAAYYCPAGRCARYWLPEGPEPVPVCTISGESLRRKRL